MVVLAASMVTKTGKGKGCWEARASVSDLLKVEDRSETSPWNVQLWCLVSSWT